MRSREPVSAARRRVFSGIRFSLANELRLPEFRKAHSICKRRDLWKSREFAQSKHFRSNSRNRPISVCAIRPASRRNRFCSGWARTSSSRCSTGATMRATSKAAFTKRFGENLPADKLERSDRDARQVLLPRFAEIRRSRAAGARGFSVEPRSSRGPCRCLLCERAGAAEKGNRGIFRRRPKAPAPRRPPRREGALAGLIAPHIDPRRGAAAYAHAYGHLKAYDAPELVIILGTSHYGSADPSCSARPKKITRRHSAR